MNKINSLLVGIIICLVLIIIFYVPKKTIEKDYWKEVQDCWDKGEYVFISAYDKTISCNHDTIIYKSN